MPKKGKFDKLKGKLIRRFYRINHYIQAEKVRVVDEKGKQISVMPLDKALNQAQQTGLDLVEVAPKAQPPVCKIIDFKKFRFQEEKKQKENQKKSKKVELKEVRLKPFIAENDFDFRIKRAKDFLKKGNKVKFTVRFRGREFTKKDFGYELLKKTVEKLSGLAEVETEPKFAGRQMEMILKPIKKIK
ncbi:MAG TPA: translation initiation factor IF-3 [Nevskiaceae bacterium]|nr:translation initiation factor IF-3 [Nevskiaceae bacterium]